ncbi:MAG TPA: T9SS type A sorting domain-containing protein, partial [Bacteroidia bacterium]|nr:T9SS type A sorting domain-containing protein [Bacteroidia bacterium]
IPDFIKKENLIYPNPSPGTFNLFLEEEAGKNFVCEITDYSGRMILSENFSVNKNSFKKEFDLPLCDNGIYFLRLRSENKVMVYKISKF